MVKVSTRICFTICAIMLAFSIQAIENRTFAEGLPTTINNDFGSLSTSEIEEYEQTDQLGVACIINITDINVSPCDSDGNFTIQIFYNFEDTEGMFTVTDGEMMNYGTFSYGEDLILGPFTGDGNSVYSFTLTDMTEATCMAAAPPVQAPTCAACSLIVTEIAPNACDENDQFTYRIAYSGTVVTDGNFTVSDGTNQYGPFNYGDPAVVGPYLGDGSSTYQFTLTDGTDPTCTATSEVVTAQVCPPIDLCEIEVDTVLVGECNSNNQFFIGLSYRTRMADTTGRTFTVTDDNNNYGTFHYGESINLGPFDGDGSSIHIFTLTDTQDSACSAASAPFTAPFCDVTANCEININQVVINACDENDNFSVSLAYNGQGVSTDSTFMVSDGTNSFGPFRFGEAFSFGTYSGDGVSQYTFTMTDTGSDCSATSETITAPTCPAVSNCNISDFEAVPTLCNGSDEFFVRFGFSATGITTGSTFNISDGTTDYGPFLYADMEGVSVGPFNGNVEASYTFTIRDNFDITCTATAATFNTPDCNVSNACSINILGTNVSECDLQQEFFVVIAYQANVVAGSTFGVVDQAGNNYGTFTYGNELTIGPIGGDGISSYAFTLIDTNDPSCTTTADMIQAPDCGATTPCSVSIDGLTVSDCNDGGTFLVGIGYSFSGGASSSFVVNDGMTNNGPFSYGDEVILGPYAGDGTSQYTFTLIDGGDLNCRAVSDSIMAPQCNNNPIDTVLTNCAISVINTTVTDCDDNDQFRVNLMYTFANPTGTEFNVVGNDGVIGTFTYGDLLSFGPFDGNGSIYNFTLVDRTDGSCISTVTTVTAPNCMPVDTTTTSNCSVGLVDAIVSDCDDSNQFTLAISYSFQQAGTNFTLVDGDIVYGPFNYGDDVLLGPFDAAVVSSFNFQMVDGTETTCRSEQLMVAAPNCNPSSDVVANDDNGSTFQDTDITLLVLVNDEGQNLVVTLEQAPNNGTATVNDNGSILYSPNPGYFGADQFMYTITDSISGDRAMAMVNLNIQQMEGGGETTANVIDDLFTISNSSSITLDVLANDEGTNISIQSVGSASGGTVTVNDGNNMLVYIPNAGFMGNDTISYTIVDGDGNTDTGFVIITVMDIPTGGGENQAPNTEYLEVCTEPITPVNICIDFTDPNGDPVKIDIEETHTTFDCGLSELNDTCFRYTPLPGLVGVDTVRVVACDNREPALCSTSIAVVHIGCAQPNADDDQVFITDEGVSVNGELLGDFSGISGAFIPVTDNDVDFCGDDLVVSNIIDAPDNGTAELVLGQIEYRPNDGFTGVDSIQYVTCNACPLCDTATVVIGVNVNPCTKNSTVCAVVNTPVQICADFCNFSATDLVSARAETGVLEQLENGCYNYIPQMDFEGTDGVVFEACTGDVCETTIVTVEVKQSCGDNPPIANTDQGMVMPGGSVSINVTDNDRDPDGDVLLLTEVTRLPNCGSVEITGNSIVYTAAEDCSGEVRFDYEVCDPSGLCDTASVYIMVNENCGNEGDYCTEPLEPIIICVDFCGLMASDTTFIQDASTTFNCSITILENNCIQYIPLPGYFGGDVVTFIGENELGETDTVLISVNISCAEPLTQDDFIEVPSGNTINIDVLDNDRDPCGNLLKTSIIFEPENGSATVNENNSISYTSRSEFSGNDVITYVACNDCEERALCDTAQVFITVIEPDSMTPIDVEPDLEQTPFNTPVTIPVLANDEGTDLEINSTTPPDNGTISTNLDGTITYTPNDGFSGSDNFFYEACGADGMCQQTIVTVTVLPENEMNQPPVANNDTEETGLGEPIIINVVGNDADPEGQEVMVTEIATPPTDGTAEINEDGTITYTPNPEITESYEDEFTYVLCDAGDPELCDTATVVIGVGIPVTNQPPMAENDVINTRPGQPVVIDPIANDTDPNEEDNLTIIFISDPTNGTVMEDSLGMLVYTPDEGFEGMDYFTYVVCDDGRPELCDTAYVTVLIDDPNNFMAEDDAAVTTIETEIEIPIQINDQIPQGTPLDSIVVTIVSDPENGTAVVTEDGNITYRPEGDFSGTDDLIYSICILTIEQCDTAVVNITVLPPLDAEPDLLTTLENTTLTANILTNDIGVDLVLTDIIDEPDFGTLIETLPNGDITYQPFVDFTGEDYFSYVVCDASGACDTATVAIRVLPVGAFNMPPTANNDQVSTPVDTPVDIDVLVNDADPNNDSLVVVSIVEDPTDGTVEIGPDGEITYTPEEGFEGCDLFAYQVCDTQEPALCDTAFVAVAVGVDICNEPPVAIDDAVTIQQNEEVLIQVLNNGDMDPDGEIVDIILGSNPAYGEVIPMGDAFLYVPDNGFFGTDYFSYIICDNGEPVLCDTAVVEITVTSLPIEAAPDIAFTGIDEPVNIPVLQNDMGTNLSVTNIVYGPNHGEVEINSDGTVTYTPEEGYEGTDYFGYQTCDEEGICDETLVTVVVLPADITNLWPIAVNDVDTTPVNTPIPIDALENDYDPYGGTEITIIEFEQPENGTVELGENGIFVYTPNEDFVGQDEFDYIICDNGNPVLCDTATVVISIGIGERSNDPPVAEEDFLITSVNTPFEINILSNDFDPNDDNITITWNSEPENGTLEGPDEEGNITYTPNDEFVGQDFFSYVICDDGNPVLCDTGYVQIFVEPDSLLIELVTEVETPITACIRDYLLLFDIDTISVMQTPGNGSLIIIGDCVQYVPSPEFTGQDTVVLEVCNEEGECVMVEIRIDVLPDADPPVANDDTFTIPVTDTATLDVLPNDFDPNDHPITEIIIVDGPNKEGASVMVDSNLNVIYVPIPDSAYIDTFRYVIVDSTGMVSDTATVIITITDEELEELEAVRDEETTPVNTSVEIPVLDNDILPGNAIEGTETVSTLEEPSNGTAVLNPDNTYTYIPNTDFIGMDTFRYQLCVAVTSGDIVCDSTEVVVTVQDESCEITNTMGISPNGDNQNDFLIFEGLDSPCFEDAEFELLIYNRWGDLVYRVNDYDPIMDAWDGRYIYNGEPVPDGTYFFVLWYMQDGEEKDEKGYVEVRR